MKTRLIFYWEQIKSSFWFIPLIMVLAAIAASSGFLYLDDIYKAKPEGILVWFYSGGADSARSILSTIAGAMLTVAGTVFSITLVALSLATSHFGSRLIRNFMNDRLNQSVLGIFVATFIYCLIILKTVKSEDYSGFVPNISVLFAILISIVNIFLLIIFIHHVAVSIQAENVIAEVQVNLQKSLHILFPGGLGDELENDHEMIFHEAKDELPIESYVLSSKSGYLQALSQQDILKLSVEHNLLLSIVHRQGEYVIENSELVHIHSANGISEKLRSEITDTIIIGKHRTLTLDPEFAINQMVEIACRALSPGINDPYTAISCIDNLSSSLCQLMHTGFPSPYRYDNNKNLRVIAFPLTFPEAIDTSYTQIREYGRENPAILISLMKAVKRILQYAQKGEDIEAIKLHAGMIMNTAERFLNQDYDIESIRQYYRKIESLQ